MEKFFKDKKTAKILSFLTLIFGIIALVMFFAAGANFSEPMVWVMLIFVISSLLELFAVSN